ncbi:MotA/TolQ/ExbB proton channel family protein [Cetobacterium sp. SF1]|uniref:MotA/TolQ/ExbB proton channel family protein n=1 Tax=unclassified Cetobacterium TaxID=2630983 RepID=UPI003CE681AC
MLYGYFQQGGPLVWILFGMSVIGSSIVLEKLLYLFKREKKYKKVFKQKIISLVANSQINEAIELSKNENNSIGRTVSAFLKRMNAQGDYHHFEQLAKEIEFQEVEGLERHLHILGIIAYTAPMVGLLGTVTGMIGAFNQMALLGAGNPNVVASGISQALITTAAGLIVAIPAMITYNLLNKRLDNVSDEIDKITTTIVNIIRGK